MSLETEKTEIIAKIKALETVLHEICVDKAQVAISGGISYTNHDIAKIEAAIKSLKSQYFVKCGIGGVIVSTPYYYREGGN